MKFVFLIITVFLHFLASVKANEDDYDSSPYDGYDGYESKSKSATLVEQIDTPEVLESFIANADLRPVILGYFENASGSDLELFKEVADEVGSAYAFGAITNKEMITSQKLKGSTIFVHRLKKDLDEKIDKVKSRYPSKTLSKKTLIKFIYEKSVPTIVERTKETEQLYRNVKLPIVIAFADFDREKNEKAYQYIVNRLRKVAAKFPSQFLYLISNKKDDQEDLQNYDFPTTLVDRSGEVLVGIRVQNFVYSMKQKFLVDSVQSFLEAFKAGALTGREVNFASKDSSSTEDDDPTSVVTVTSANFKEVVTDSTADVMIEFYAPWCGHCKALKPEYAKLADAFKDDDTVVIAAMDADQHQPPTEYAVSGYPTLYFVPSSTKKPVVYEGERSMEAIRDFILENKS